MHTLAFLEPGHFHAALTLGTPHPNVREEIFVYAPPGQELDDFLAIIDAFNRRAESPTAWKPVVRAGDRSLERLIADRPGNVVILAGRNDRKIAMMRRLHDAGFHILADKPWLAGPDGLDDLRHTLSGGPLAVEIMTGRHEIMSRLARKIVGEPEVFGGFDEGGMAKPAIEISGVHHLEKVVNGAPLRRPVWYFDVRVQGDGIADIPTHMVDQVQRLVAAASPGGVAPPGTLELLAVRRWATQVPRALFARVTGRPDFPLELRDVVAGSELSYLGNAELSVRLGGVTAILDTRWDLSVPPGGGDTHRSVIRGSRAEIRVEQNAETGFRRRLSILPRGAPGRVRVALERVVTAWQDAHPGLAVSEAGAGWEICVPRELDAGHESHFPLVLADFLTRVERGSAASNLAEETLAKYTLLTRASIEARRHIPQ
ncbi:MAG TPA: putative oxidoreductase C-terminal domain-containing protein [Methylomirabilota bacterium]